jgi:hypothetical protein
MQKYAMIGISGRRDNPVYHRALEELLELQREQLLRFGCSN